MAEEKPNRGYDALPMHFGMNLASAIGGEEFMGITLTAVVIDGDHAFFDAGATRPRLTAWVLICDHKLYQYPKT